MSKGIASNLMKASAKRRRSKAQIAEEKLREQHKEAEYRKRMEQMEAEHRRRQQEHQDAVDDEYEETLAKYVSDSFLLPPFPSTPFYMRMNETHLPLSEIK